MLVRCLWLGILCSTAAWAAALPDWYTRHLDDADFQARLVRDVGEIERITGDQFSGDVILIELRVRPLYGSHVALERGDFLLRSRRDNDTSPAQNPERIAGGAVLALGKERHTAGGGLFSDSTNAPVWGGAPGTGTRPRRLGGPPNLAGGGVSGEETQTVEQRTTTGTGDPILDRLYKVELPLETQDQPVSGYLYFEVPAKTKRKHLELSYDGGLGNFLIEFKKPE